MLVPPVQIIECPRDAIQGWPHPVDTSLKADYLNTLLQVGFHTLDAGSFVSPKAIPQMADTAQVLKKLNRANSRTEILVIVANLRGAVEASTFEEVDYLGFPFSLSPTFQLRNTNSTPEASLSRVEEILELCSKQQKKLVLYLSMGFGNPYNDPYSTNLVQTWCERFVAMGVPVISVADTVGIASSAQIAEALNDLPGKFPQTTIGVHLHSSASNWRDKLDAAYQAGIRRFDGALRGIGGCPMAGDELVGNMDTNSILQYLQQQECAPSLNLEALAEANLLAARIFK